MYSNHQRCLCWYLTSSFWYDICQICFMLWSNKFLLVRHPPKRCMLVSNKLLLVWHLPNLFYVQIKNVHFGMTSTRTVLCWYLTSSFWYDIMGGELYQIVGSHGLANNKKLDPIGSNVCKNEEWKRSKINEKGVKWNENQEDNWYKMLKNC